MTKAYKRTTRKATAPKPVVLPEPVDVRKAKNLPMFGPGLVIPVPLALWPTYMNLYNLGKLERSTKPGVDLFVKRLPKEETNEQ